MASQLTDTDICNMALDLLEEAPITSIDEASSVARWFKRNFWPKAWALMRKHPWNFALARIVLTENAATPTFGWSYAYQAPVDFLRILPLTVDGEDNGVPLPYKVEQDQILTDQPAPIYVRYIKRISNTGQFDNSFCEALAALLAMGAAHLITGKQSYADRMQQVFQSQMLDAQSVDALEGTPEDPIDNDWIAARG